MIVREIVSTCTNPHVAYAAIASIGGEFAGRFSGEAARRALPSGHYAAELVRGFALRAHERDWRALYEAIRGADMPVLSGLRYILEQEGERDADGDSGASRPMRKPRGLAA